MKRFVPYLPVVGPVVLAAVIAGILIAAPRRGQIDYISLAPESPSRRAIIFVHGGGGVMGDKHDCSYAMRQMARRGWHSYSVGYRLAPKHSIPDALADIESAVADIAGEAYIHEPRRFDTIVLCGVSQGGWYAWNVAARCGHITHFVGLSTPYDIENWHFKHLRSALGTDSAASLTPLRQRPTHPLRTMLAYGRRDTVIPPAQAVTMQAYLRRIHVPCVTFANHNGGHADWLAADNERLFDTVDRWAR